MQHQLPNSKSLRELEDLPFLEIYWNKQTPNQHKRWSTEQDHLSYENYSYRTNQIQLRHYIRLCIIALKHCGLVHKDKIQLRPKTYLNSVVPTTAPLAGTIETGFWTKLIWFCPAGEMKECWTGILLDTDIWFVWLAALTSWEQWIECA